ncbi:hypothetical protein JCM16307_21900 [Thermococcus prieurii]
MTPFGEVHNHYAPEGRYREVNAGKWPFKKPPVRHNAQLVSKRLSASACASKGSSEVKE